MPQARSLSLIAKHKRIRKKIQGTPQRPRATVHRSLKNLHIQLIDDTQFKTLLSLSTQDQEIKNKSPQGGNVKAATLLGEVFAKKAQAAGIKLIVFDRGGYLYHGRIKALADSLRKGGLEF